MADYISNYTGVEIDTGIAESYVLKSIATNTVPVKNSSGEYVASSITEDTDGVYISKNLTIPDSTLYLGEDGTSVSGAGRAVQTTTAGSDTGLFIVHKYDDDGSAEFETHVLDALEDIVVNDDNSGVSASAPFSFNYTVSFSRHTSGITVESPDSGDITATVRLNAADGPVIRTVTGTIVADTPTQFTFKPIRVKLGDELYWTVSGQRLKGTGSGASFLPAATLHTHRSEAKRILTEDDIVPNVYSVVKASAATTATVVSAGTYVSLSPTYIDGISSNTSISSTPAGITVEETCAVKVDASFNCEIALPLTQEVTVSLFKVDQYDSEVEIGVIGRCGFTAINQSQTFGGFLAATAVAGDTFYFKTTSTKAGDIDFNYINFAITRMDT